MGGEGFMAKEEAAEDYLGWRGGPWGMAEMRQEVARRLPTTLLPLRQRFKWPRAQK